MVNFFIYLVIGGIIGWLASLIMKTDAQQGVIANIVVGVVGAYLAGLALNGGAINRDLGPASLGAALAGSVLVLAVYNMIRKGRIR